MQLSSAEWRAVLVTAVGACPHCRGRVWRRKYKKTHSPNYKGRLHKRYITWAQCTRCRRLLLLLDQLGGNWELVWPRPHTPHLTPEMRLDLARRRRPSPTSPPAA